jgi:hypothetical protein
MKMGRIEGATSWREGDQRYARQSVFLKQCSGVWTNHSLMPPLLQQWREPGEETEQADTRQVVAPKKGVRSMDVVDQRGAGVDVHQRFLVVCLRIVEAGQRRKEIRRVRNETADLFAFRAWLVQEQCRAVGMERTGVYWMPVYRRLEGFFELIVANAQHMKAVPGRKTDVQDADGIADLLHHGLLTASVVPSQEQHDLRDLTRLRVSLVQERARLVNRVHTVLDAVGWTLSVVLSDILGFSGKRIVQARCAGETDPVS